jgi:hypothetical protein
MLAAGRAAMLGAAPRAIGFDPANIGSGITLSADTLTATYNGAAQNDLARAKFGRSTGKFYFEFVFNPPSSGGSDWMGLFSDATTLHAAASGSNKGIAVNGANGIIATDGGATLNSGAQLNGGAGFARGTVVGIAVDLDNKLFWARIAPSGNWNGSGTANPATATGGFSFSTLSALFYPGVMFGSFAADAVILHTLATSWSGAAPAGFSPWF